MAALAASLPPVKHQAPAGLRAEVVVLARADVAIALALTAIGFSVVFAWTMRASVPAAITIFLFGIASFALVPPLQMRVMQAADVPNPAAAMKIGAFNLGNAIGAAAGGAVLWLGLGHPAIALSAASTC